AEAAQRITSSGLIVGTPLYMSPEQLAGEVPGPASDQFTLAVIAFELLTGSLPFEAATQQQQVAARMVRPARSLRSAAPGVSWSDGLEAALATALHREPAERHASVTIFAQRLTAQIAAVPPSVDEARTQLLTSVTRAQPGTLEPEPAAEPPAAGAGDVVAVRVLEGGDASPTTARARRRRWGAIVAVVVAIGALTWQGLAVRRASRESGRDREGGLPETLGAPVVDGRVVRDSTARGQASGAPQDAPGRGAVRIIGPSRTATDSLRDAAGRGRGSDTGHSAALATGVRAPQPTAVPQSAASPDETRSGSSRQDPGSAGGGTGTPSTATGYDAERDLARVRQLLQDENAEADVTRALAGAREVLARATKRADSTRALMYAGQAHAYLGETEAACASLAQSARLATGTTLAPTLQRILSRLECRG
ncbi:MAG: hypothetical protein HY275_01045, partial [Gemmatimonadetes bacterium]|nr:hypothetical protein [Gemmatimonadota bacterium]